MRFEYPLVLVLIPVAVAILYVITPGRLSFYLRCLIIALLLCAVAGLEVKSKTAHLARIYAVDNSGSVFLDRDALIESIINDVRSLAKDDKVGLVVFGNNAVVDILPATPDSFIETLAGRKFSVEVGYANTNIEKALTTCAGLLPTGYRKEIFLISDGNETIGDAGRVAYLLARDNIRLFCIPSGPADFKDIRIDQLDLPPVVGQNEPLEMRFILSASIDTRTNVYIYHGNKLIKELKSVPLVKGNPSRFALTLEPLKQPLQTYEMKIATTDYKEFCLENNQSRAVVRKSGKSSVLYLSGSTDSTVYDYLKSSDAYFVDRAVKPAENLLYDIIVLDNFSYPFTKGLKPFVENGGGLVVLGGKNSFGLGNYADTELEEVLPVWATPREGLALAIIIDASGSMNEPSGIDAKTKFAVASEALEQSMSVLAKSDKVEIIAFNQGFEVLSPFQPVAEIKGLRQHLAQVSPAGSTIINAPIRQKALPLLDREKAEKKHIIIISDGYSTGGETIQDFQETGRLLQDAKITISALATGEKVNRETLLALSMDETNGGVATPVRATERRGKFYHLKNISELANMLKSDLRVKKELSRENGTFTPAVNDDKEILKGISVLPVVSGYNRTGLKDKARLVASFPKDEPLIADWQYGQGRTMVFTSAYNNEWGKGWLEWSDSGQVLDRMLKWVTPERAGRKQDFRITSDLAQQDTLTLSLVPANPITGAVVFTARHHPGQGDERIIKFNQVTVDRYEATIPDLQEGFYSVAVYENDVLMENVPVIIPYSKEWTRFTPDTVRLRQIAETTGGRILLPAFMAESQSRPGGNRSVGDDIQDYKGTDSQTIVSYQNISASLIMLAVLVFLIDLALMRVFC